MKKQARFISVICVFEFFETCAANAFTLEFGNFVFAVTEETGGRTFSKDDIAAVYVYLDRIRAFYIKLLSDFLRDNYSSEFIDVSDNACGFHNAFLS